jgi:hypothetical protein
MVLLSFSNLEVIQIRLRHCLQIGKIPAADISHAANPT